MLTAIYIHYTQKWLCLQWYIFTEVIIYTLARAPRWPQQTSIAHPGKDAQPIQKSHHFPKTWQENRLSKGKPNYLNLFSGTCSGLWAFLNLRLFNPPNCANTEVLVRQTISPADLSLYFPAWPMLTWHWHLKLPLEQASKRPLSNLICEPNFGSLTFLCNLVCQKCLGGNARHRLEHRIGETVLHASQRGRFYLFFAQYFGAKLLC